MKMTFHRSTGSYRKTIKKFRKKLITHLDKMYGNDFHEQWSFFRVEESKYVERVCKQSLGIATQYKLVHFSIIDKEFVFDFLVSPQLSLKHTTA